MAFNKEWISIDINLSGQLGTFSKKKKMRSNRSSYFEVTRGQTFDKSTKTFPEVALTLNPSKFVTRAVHLNNREANRELRIVIDGQNIAFEESPKYLGVKFDRTLTISISISGKRQK